MKFNINQHGFGVLAANAMSRRLRFRANAARSYVKIRPAVWRPAVLRWRKQGRWRKQRLTSEQSPFAVVSVSMWWVIYVHQHFERPYGQSAYQLQPARRRARSKLAWPQLASRVPPRSAKTHYPFAPGKAVEHLLRNAGIAEASRKVTVVFRSNSTIGLPRLFAKLRSQPDSNRTAATHKTSLRLISEVRRRDISWPQIHLPPCGQNVESERAFRRTTPARSQTVNAPAARHLTREEKLPRPSRLTLKDVLTYRRLVSKEQVERTSHRSKLLWGQSWSVAEEDNARRRAQSDLSSGPTFALRPASGGGTTLHRAALNHTAFYHAALRHTVLHRAPFHRAVFHRNDVIVVQKSVQRRRADLLTLRRRSERGRILAGASSGPRATTSHGLVREWRSQRQGPMSFVNAPQVSMRKTSTSEAQHFALRPELTWRRNVREVAESGIPLSNEVGSISKLPSSFSRRVMNEENSSSRLIAADARSARQVPIDSVFLDRLTDDVVRRVEKRIRIDRERRGL